jgi:hypothetical protein
MGYQKHRLSRRARLWSLAEGQHGVVTRAQMVELGFHPQAIKHRIARGRLHPLWRGVYAVGRPQVTRHGRWLAAVLSCGPDAVLSHGSAAALWEIGAERSGWIEVSVPKRSPHGRAGVVVHRRAALTVQDVTSHEGIPVTTAVCTLVDLGPRLGSRRLERAIKETDVRGLPDPDTLRAALGEMRGRRGVALLRQVLDRHTFALTDSELERRFLPIARAAGLPLRRPSAS